MRVLPAGELTFVFTDVEGSTRLLATLGERYLEIHARHQALVRASVARHDGIEVSTEGDGFFLVFRDAPSAALAAAEALTAIERDTWPEDGRVRIRIGVHTGRAVLVADDYVGIDVNRASRITAAANGGQILLSSATAHLVGEATAGIATVRDIGRHRLKDVGIEQLFRLEPVGTEPDPRPPRSLEAAPSNLPAATRPLVDRVDERDRAEELLLESRLLTITGAGGIGKSALALALAERVRARFIDGVGYVDLATVGDVETATAMLADGLSLPSDPGRPAPEQLAEQLRTREVLLVIETAEHLPRIADWLASLVRDCPRVGVIVTSQIALHVQAERELRLEPLPNSAAIDLFVARARTIRPSFEPSRADESAIAAIARRLDGLPLAIELAAARTRLLSPSQILDRLDRRLPILSAAAFDVPARQRTLRATVEWSYQQLTEPERALLQLLAAFANDFGLEAVERIVAAVGRRIDPSAVIDLMEGLVDKSLVDFREAPESRFRLLMAIREFAHEELVTGDRLGETLDAHLGWVLELARETAAVVDPPGPTDEVPLRAYEEDLRSALGYALGEPERALVALELAATAGPFWYALGRAREGATWLDRAIAAAPAGTTAIHGNAHYWAGVLADERRQPGEARRHLERSLAIRRELGDEAAVTRTINSLGIVARSEGDLPRARALLTECLERKRAAGDPRTGSTITNLAIVAVDEGDLDAAGTLFEEALEADRLAGSVDPHPAVLLGIGFVHVRLGHPDRAVEPILTAARRFVALDDQLSVAECLDVLVEAWQATHPRKALVLFQAANGIHDAEGIPRPEKDEARIRAVADAIAANLAATDVTELAAVGRALDGSAAVAYADAADG